MSVLKRHPNEAEARLRQTRELQVFHPLKRMVRFELSRGDLALIHKQAVITNGHTRPVASTPVIDPPRDRKSTDVAPLQAPSGAATPTAGEDVGDTPQSPFFMNRATIRDLTLPTVPNLDIPPSPPGSPPPGLDKKFEHFLELKRRGVHFNEKLARSSALKNPNLLGKLMGFAGVEEDEQYSSTLPKDVWDPSGFPAWAFKEELAKSQQEVLKQQTEERAKVQRESIDFVSASASASAQSGRDGTPASVSNNKGLRGSAAERIMAGLDRERLRSPQMSNLTSRSNSSRRRSRSPQRQRKRSRSR